jgi:hypothetical protein
MVLLENMLDGTSIFVDPAKARYRQIYRQKILLAVDRYQ